MRHHSFLAAGLAGILTVASAGGAGADTYVPWTDQLPPLPAGYAPTRENLCIQGQPKCVDTVIKELNRRLAPQVTACDHNLIFTFFYLRTTEHYRAINEIPGYFDDPAHVNHQDTVFADYFFEQQDAWNAGNNGEVADAWNIAWDAGRGQRVTASGNLLLGINAHIGRDMPYVLESIGLNNPDGTSRKADHDKNNRWLIGVTDPVTAEGARRFDPTLDDNNVPGTTLDSDAIYNYVQGLREQAWRYAEQLAAAETPAERASVESMIETSAATQARAIVAATSYVAPLNSPAPRNGYCSINRYNS